MSQFLGLEHFGGKQDSLVVFVFGPSTRSEVRERGCGLVLYKITTIWPVPRGGLRGRHSEGLFPEGEML